MRAEAHGCLFAKKGFQEIFQRAFQVAHAHFPGHVEALNLVEGRKVGSINRIAAERGTGADDAHGRAVFLHHAGLHGAGLGAQQLAAVEIEGILLVAGGVVIRGVQGIKAVPLVLNLRAIGQGEAHAAQHAHCFIAHNGNGVQPASRQGGTGHGEICPGHGGGINFLLQSGLAVLQRSGDGSAGLVQQRPHGGLVFLGHIAHALLHLGESTFLAQDTHAGILQRFHIGNAGYARQGFCLYACNLIFHNGSRVTIRA